MIDYTQSVEQGSSETWRYTGVVNLWETFKFRRHPLPPGKKKMKTFNMNEKAL